MLKCKTVKQLDTPVYEDQLRGLVEIVELLDHLLVAANPEAQQAVPDCLSAQANPAADQTSSIYKPRLTVDIQDHVSVAIHTGMCLEPQLSAGVQDMQPAGSFQAPLGTSAWPCLHGTWPTPSAKEWVNIKLVLARIMYVVALLRQRQRFRKLPGTYKALKTGLFQLTCKLLSGHVSNPDLDFGEAFHFAFPTVLRELAEQDPQESMRNGVCQLGTLLMQRAALDPNLMRSGNMQDLCPEFQEPEHSMSLWKILGEKHTDGPGLNAGFDSNQSKHEQHEQ